MAPVTEDLHELVSKLEARVQQLEQKLSEASGGSPKPAGDAKGIRMILMGPPGAGLSSCHVSSLTTTVGPAADIPLQAKELKPQRSRKSSHAVIW